MATHYLKVALISSALRSLINITTDQAGETHPGTQDQSKKHIRRSGFIQLITEAVCDSGHRPEYRNKSCPFPSSSKQQFEEIFFFHFRPV